jgi:hypothetical protein
MLMTAFGAMIGASLTVLMIAAIIETIWLKARWPWLPIAVRIAGAWATAVAVLLAALAFKASTL